MTPSQFSDPPNLGGNELVPKPPGSVGHATRSGYDLRTVLAWDDPTYESTKVGAQALVHDLAGRYLNISTAYGKQDQRKIDLVCQKACQEDPRLLGYESFWPVKDLLKVLLFRNVPRPRSRARSRSSCRDCFDI
ncbi:hypothetical protein AURDEDRAFT_130400 [Auricularia subglabra TFB-10046 SS5]|nr:hypothetical protein AURDEDRAFT_130400 [Auricularia subglabra TFB-10046 SS5]